jgi:ankyrin repeat protein
MLKEFNLEINSRNDKGSTALHWAAYNSSYLTITYLIALGADVNKVDCRGVSVLHLAV